MAIKSKKKEGIMGPNVRKQKYQLVEREQGPELKENEIRVSKSKGKKTISAALKLLEVLTKNKTKLKSETDV